MTIPIKKRSILICVNVVWLVLTVHSQLTTAFTMTPPGPSRHYSFSSSTLSTLQKHRSLSHTLPYSISSLSPLPSSSSSSSSSTRLYGLLDFLSPYESKIPPELKDEIFKAEANTSAAKDRGVRIAVYTVFALVGVSLAVFNGFLTEIRMTGIDGNGLGVVPPDDGSTKVGVEVLVEAGFGWVLQNPIYRFLFTNKIGGGLCILLGGASGLLAEAELDTKRLNAEKIYEELERRREQKTNKKKPQASSSATTGKKKRRSGKERKRLGALSEVVMTVEETATQQAGSTNVDANVVGIRVDGQGQQNLEGEKDDLVVVTPDEQSNAAKGGGSLFDQMKSMYEKADSMAASSALLLNKQLEDAGVVEKITDGTGLNIIGKEEAKKLQQQKEEMKNQEKEKA
jgi:hypothetical protein